MEKPSLKKQTRENNKWEILFFSLFIIFSSIRVAFFINEITGEISPPISDFIIRIIHTISITCLVSLMFLYIGKRSLFITAYILQTFYLALNLLYYFLTGSHLSLLQIFLVKEGIYAINSLTSVLDYRLALLLIDLPFMIVFTLHFKNVRRKLFEKKAIFNAAIITCFVLLLLLEGALYYKGASIIESENYNFLVDNFYDEDKFISLFGTMGHNYVSLGKIFKKAEGIRDVQYIGVKESGGANEMEPVNVITIQIESLDASIIGKKQNNITIMPYLSDIAGKNIYYRYLLANRGTGGTKDSEVVVFNGADGFLNIPDFEINGYEFPDSFVKKLSANNYTTYAFHGNDGSYFSRIELYKNLGFDYFFDIKEMNLTNEGWGAADHKVFDFILKKLENQRGPFYYHIITMSSHPPYSNFYNYYNCSMTYIQPYSKQRSNLSVPKMEFDYHCSMNYVDRSLNDFVSKVLEDKPNTYIFIYGDHAAGSQNIRTLCKIDGRKMEFAPLIIISPNGELYFEKSQIASFMDIGITILDLTKVKYIIKTNGNPLLPPGDLKEYLFSQNSWIDRSKIYSYVESNNC